MDSRSLVNVHISFSAPYLIHKSKRICICIFLASDPHWRSSGMYLFLCMHVALQPNPRGMTPNPSNMQRRERNKVSGIMRALRPRPAEQGSMHEFGCLGLALIPSFSSPSTLFLCAAQKLILRRRASWGSIFCCHCTGTFTFP